MKIRLFLIAALLATVALPSLARAAGSAGSADTPIGGACSADAQCAVGSICTDKICTALPKGKRIFPFYWHQPGDVGHRYIIPVLYFSKWDREGSTQVQFPFFAHTRNYADQSTTTILPWLLFWVGTYEGGGAKVGWLPIFFWKHRGPERWFVAPLLLSGGRSDASQDLVEAVVLLAGYYRRHKDDTWRVVAPLFFDHETKTTRTTFAPPLLAYFRRTENKRTDVVFPFLWHIRDKKKGSEHVLFLPFFDWDSEANGRRQLVISLLAAWERNDDAQLRQLVLWTPPVFHRSDALREVDVVPPLFTRWKVRDDDSSGLIAGPFFHYGDTTGSTTSLLPIYWRFTDRKADAETQFIFPVAGYHRHPGAGGGFVGPLYGWGSKNGLGGWGAGLAPILMFGRSGTKHHAVVAPLFLRYSDDKDQSSTTAIGPGFFHRVGNGGGYDAGLFPALFFGRRGANSYGIVPPIFFHRGDEEGTTDVVGPLYVQRGKRGWRAGLAPLAFFADRDGEQHQVVLPPLFIRFANPAKRQEQMIAGPYYHKRDGDRTIDALFPLFYLRRSPGRALLVAPLAGWQKSPRQETIVVGPYGYQSNAQTKSRTHLLFPLGVVHDAPNYHVVVQFPFYWRVREGQETDTVAFPIYWRVRSPDKDVDAVFPLFLQSRTKVATTTIFGPLWNRTRKDGGRNLGLFPAFAYGKMVAKDGRASSWFGMPGIYWDKNETAGNSDLVVGNFFRITRPEGYTGGLIPIAFAWRRGTASKVLTPIFYRQADRADNSALNVLGPLYFGHTGETKRLGLAPILFFKWNKDGTSSSTIFPLVYFRKKQVGSILATALFGYSSYADGFRAYAGPVYVRRDAEVSSTAIWPLVYFSKNHVRHSSVGMALPLYFGGRAKDGRELSMYTPLIWRYHSVERSVIVGLPLFFDVHSFHESRTTGLLPFFIRNDSQVYKSTSWVFPPILAWARTRRGADPGNDFVVFPLVWRFGGRDPTTIVAPLFWDVTRGESRTTVMFPIFARWKRSDGVYHLIFNMYYRKGLGDRAGSWYVDVFPLAQFGRPRKGDVEWKLLEGLFGYSRTGRNRILHLLWIFDIPLEPAPASSLVWWSNTPPSARTEF